MSKEEKELEEAVIEARRKLATLSNRKKITQGLYAVDLKELLERVEGFIDYAKFEFGERVTEGQHGGTMPIPEEGL